MSDDRIRFQVETDRILEILSKEIYDSPYALLRENIQNAYDAVLMRATVEGRNLQDFEITIRIEPQRVTITDNGIGMDEEVLRNSFWKAGSSGKRTELAKQSGVIGTFGIGAMANFGVCSALRVETRHVDSPVTLISTAERQRLSIAEDCIDLVRASDDREPGTTLTADLDAVSNLDENSARSYLEPYVRFLPVRVLLNEKNISQQSFEDAIGDRIRGCEVLSTLDVSEAGHAFNVQVLVDPNGQVLMRITDMRLQDETVGGQLFLIQKGGQLFGLRNYFGLAPIPVSSYYELGGYANLSVLHPTAGREALSRESIDHVNGIIRLVECAATEELAKTKHADRNIAFL